MIRLLNFFTVACIVCMASTTSQAESLQQKIDGAKAKIKAATEVENLFPTFDAAGAFDAGAERIGEFSEQIAAATPQLEKMGFSLSTFRIQLLPPTGKLRLTSRNTEDAALLMPADVQYEEEAPLLAKAILKSAATAKTIQKLMKLELVVMDVELGMTPTIKLSYLKEADSSDKEGTQFQDIDLLCGQAL